VIHLPCYDVSPRHNFLLVFPRKIAIQIISRQRTKSHYEATRHHGDIVTKIIVGVLRLGNTGKRERETKRGKEEREKKREKVQIQENDTHYRRNEFAARFEKRVGTKPSFLHAADYSAAAFYLKAVLETGSDDPETTMAWMRSNPINDMFVTNGYVRKDGRMISDVYLRQVKTPAESKYPWDYFRTVSKLPNDEIYIQQAESGCALWKD